jgi:hypothetical protein
MPGSHVTARLIIADASHPATAKSTDLQSEWF